MPEPPQGAHEQQRDLDLVRIDGPAQGGPHVRVVEREAVQPHGLFRGEQVAGCSLREPETGHRMSAAHLGFGTVLGEAAEREVLDRPDHREPDPARARRRGHAGGSRVASDQAVLGQRHRPFEAFVASVRQPDDRDRLVAVESAVEDGEGVEGGLLLGRQQVVTPGDRTLERPLSGRCVTRT